MGRLIEDGGGVGDCGSTATVVCVLWFGCAVLALFDFFAVIVFSSP